MSTATAAPRAGEPRAGETQTGHVPVASATEGGKPIMSHRQILLVIYGLMAGMFLSALDQTIVGTAIRTIGDDLKGLDQQAWVTTAYLITSTIATPIYGKLSDLFGRRPLYIFGISIFILGSLLSTFSTSMLMLAGFRAIQGIGAGALMSLPLAIMGDILAPRDRAKYQGYFLAVFGISSVIGPLIGGLFAGADSILFLPGWRWVFLVNIPIGIVALAMVLAFLHLPKFRKDAKPRIDWWGATSILVTLVPLLLVAEQGRVWGWASAGSIACYAIGAAGLITFLVVETRMGADAIIPLRLFRNSWVFSMATGLGVLVGFGMFGAMLTLPLYLQIVQGLTPTESGLATLPMMAGLMIASIGSGQIISRTGRYRIFPVTGTAVTAVGFLVLTQLTYDKPLWFAMIGMFFIGLGLGQLMQTLTLASQSAVQPQQMGVATSASTFFRQIGGTLGVAVLLSVLFAALPGNILTATADRATLTSSLDAALDPAVGGAAKNAAVMKQLWNPIVDPLKSGVQKNLDAAAAQVASAPPALRPQALEAAATKSHSTVVGTGLSVDWADDAQRGYWVDQLAPSIQNKIQGGDPNASGASSGSISDTSFLNGADARLTKPFMVGFVSSAVTVYWIGFAVIMLAFVLSWFFRVPPLRKTSALQEQADAQGVTATGTVGTQPPTAP
ncbi:MAG: MFS transporter [Micrococcales bacterium]|nr:MFS transporter [Micrococcales bacterium]